MWYTKNHMLKSKSQLYKDYYFFKEMLVRKDIAEAGLIRSSKKYDRIDIHEGHLSKIITKFNGVKTYPIVNKVFTSLPITDKVEFVWEFTNSENIESTFDGIFVGWIQWRLNKLRMKPQWSLTEDKILIGRHETQLIFVLMPLKE